MNKNIVILFLLFSAYFQYADSIFSPLVVIEERIKGEFQTENLPFTESIFSLLWDHDVLFFDKKLSSPVQKKAAKIDPYHFAEVAELAGSDSLVLFSIDYNFLPINEKKDFYLLEGTAYLTVFILGNKEKIIDKSIDLAELQEKQPVSRMDKEKTIKQLALKLIQQFL